MGQTVLKAIYGSVTTGLGALAVAFADNVVTTQEWITVVIAALGAFGVIWGVPNAGKDKPSA